MCLLVNFRESTIYLLDGMFRKSMKYKIYSDNLIYYYIVDDFKFYHHF